MSRWGNELIHKLDFAGEFTFFVVLGGNHVNNSTRGNVYENERKQRQNYEAKSVEYYSFGSIRNECMATS